MIRPFVMAFFALASIAGEYSADCQVRKAQPVYTPISLCEISFHPQKANPKFISVHAEFVNATPHGLVLTDRRCANRGLQIDFADTGLDPSVALIKDHLFQIWRADGTFRGVLKRDPDSGRLYLWLQSVANFKSSYYQPEPGPVRLPELPPFPPLPPE
jgi:hypothetical protein